MEFPFVGRSPSSLSSLSAPAFEWTLDILQIIMKITRLPVQKQSIPKYKKSYNKHFIGEGLNKIRFEQGKRENCVETSREGTKCTYSETVAHKPTEQRLGRFVSNIGPYIISFEEARVTHLPSHSHIQKSLCV